MMKLTEMALFEKARQIEAKAEDVEREIEKLTRIKEEQYSKEVELVERDKVLSAYVNQLNHCISQLTIERGSLVQLKS